MKKWVYIFLAGFVLLTACHKAIWDKLNDHEVRIAKLEAFCNQMNTNISSLQTLVNAINARDYVKEVIPITENGLVIGYTISFNSSNPITLFNGKNGEDAPAPLIGIKQDSDNNWYWTLNGDWILDDNGQKVRADGTTPLLKIEADYWWVSYDNGNTWQQMGTAVGEQGGTGDSMFKEIRQDDRYVYLVLADGEVITIAKGGLHWEYVD